MGEDVQAVQPVRPVPTINLEISVPHIVLPTSRERERLDSGDNIDEAAPSMVEAPLAGAMEPDEIEQVRILQPGAQRSAAFLQRHEQPGTIVGTASPHENQKGKRRFRMFHIQDLPAQGQALLLQILRPGRSKTRKSEDQLAPPDELVFSVEFRRLGESSGTSQIEPAPVLVTGLNRVVIFLDEENIPCSYTIDGAEG